MHAVIRPGVVALAWPANENDFNDPQYEISMDAYERLSNTTDAKGRKLKIYKVPCPPAMFRTYKESGGLQADHIEKGYVPRIPGERLPATYINHWAGGMLNGQKGAVVPQFGAGAAEADKRALEILAEVRKISSPPSGSVIIDIKSLVDLHYDTSGQLLAGHACN